MTSRAEYRLTLRQDNADLRLTKKGYEIGLVSRERYEKTLEKERLVNEELNRLKKVIVTPTKEVNEFLYQLTNNTIKTGVSLYDLLKRPELNYDAIKELDPDRPDLPKEIRIQVETEIKYEGYIKKQMSQIEQFKRMENKAIPKDIDYKQVKSLSTEALQKLEKIRPESIGQASRISGVSPSDINVLLIHLEQLKRRETGDK
jgi:tRNA uridine 5-carboxymethylaminomethyl modification enzyme